MVLCIVKVKSSDLYLMTLVYPLPGVSYMSHKGAAAAYERVPVVDISELDREHFQIEYVDRNRPVHLPSFFNTLTKLGRLLSNPEDPELHLLMEAAKGAGTWHPRE